MAIKLKNWTARRPIKIGCMILIPVLLFFSMIGVIRLSALDYASAELLFVDLSSNDYFYDRYVPNAISAAHDVFFYQSEEHIRDMGCLQWQSRGFIDEYYEDGKFIRFEEYELISFNASHSWTYSTIRKEDLETETAKQMVTNAMNQQINNYHDAKNRLDQTPGLYYYISDGNRVLRNTPDGTDTQFFHSNPVHWLAETGNAITHSRNDSDLTRSYNNNHYHDYYSTGYNDSRNATSCYIAFSGEMVSWQNNIWQEAQRQFKVLFAGIAAPLIIMFVSIIILMVGAGRKYGDDSEKIHLMTIDKPWLDIGFGLLLGFEVLVFVLFYEAASIAWRYNNLRWIFVLCAILSVFFTFPVLWWLLSFIKRCKSGKWWKHTFLFKLFHGICSGVNRFVKSLWAGFPLTLRVILIGCALFGVNAICIITNSSAEMLLFTFVFTAFIIFYLLRYARKLHLLEQGAQNISSGTYNIPIAVTGGELGRIADSINNISEGINVAVAERLKSERFKTELITNISHDIRTPLTSLITYTDLLKSEGLDNEKAPEYLEVLIQKSARLKTLTDDLFEASKAASGNIDVCMETLDLADFIRQVLGELDEKVRASGLDFRLNLPEHAPVRADGRLLLRVMENLLSNVFKYALTGSRVYIDIDKEDEMYRLSIKNISEHPLNVDPSELIERFKRGDEARSGEGSGLGLSIAQSFMASQGGRFTLSIDGDLFKASLYLAEI